MPTVLFLSIYNDCSYFYFLSCIGYVCQMANAIFKADANEYKPRERFYSS